MSYAPDVIYLLPQDVITIAHDVPAEGRIAYHRADWIHVSERLPELYEEVAVLVERPDLDTTGYVRDILCLEVEEANPFEEMYHEPYYYFVDRDGEEPRYGQPDFWMPLPPGPSGDKDE